jgi:hypothetical protein
MDETQIIEEPVNLDLYYCLMRYTVQKKFENDKVILDSVPTKNRFVLDKTLTEQVLQEFKAQWDLVIEGPKPIYSAEQIAERVMQLESDLTNY